MNTERKIIVRPSYHLPRGLPVEDYLYSMAENTRKIAFWVKVIGIIAVLPIIIGMLALLHR